MQSLLSHAHTLQILITLRITITKSFQQFGKNKKYGKTSFGENWVFTGNENEKGYLQQGYDTVVGIANAIGKSISKSMFLKS